MFCVAVFLGFEGTAIYGEEARDPKRTIPRATYLCVGLISGFYLLTTWVIAMAYGTNEVQKAAQSNPTGLVFGIGGRYIGGPFVDLMMALFITSTFAACLGMHNAVARYQFSLARERMLPERLSETHPVWKSPHKSSLTQSVLVVLVTVGFWVSGQDPITIVFALLLAIGTLGVMVIWVMTSASIVKYFGTVEHDENVFKSLIAPAVSGLGLAAIIVVLLKNWDLQTGMPDSWASYLPISLVAVLVLGFILPLPGGAAHVRERVSAEIAPGELA